MIIVIAKKYNFPLFNIKNNNKDSYYFDSILELNRFYNEHTKNDVRKNDEEPMLVLIGKYLKSNFGTVSTEEFVKNAKNRLSCIVVIVSTEIDKSDFKKLELKGDTDINKLLGNLETIHDIEKIVSDKDLIKFGKVLEEIINPTIFKNRIA